MYNQLEKNYPMMNKSAYKTSLKPIISPKIPRKSVDVLKFTNFDDPSPNLNSNRILSLTFTNSSDKVLVIVLNC